MADDSAEVARLRAALPPGFRIINDGPGREVLVHDEWEECPVFPTVAEAAARAWEIANER